MLPVTATDLAKAFDLVEERLFDLPVDAITKDPWRAPVEYLDHLAWEMSVDAWDPDWDEGVRRAVIAASPEVHRYKGTPHAIRTALSAFGVAVEIIEWFAPGGSGVRGTFVVRAFVTDPLQGQSQIDVTMPIIDAMKAVLNGAAPVSRGWSLQIGARAKGPAYVGVYGTSQILATAAYLQGDAPISEASARVGLAPFVRIAAVAAAA